ncbi:MAG: dipeptidase [Acidobacteriaceae bacterium]|nr:dipeptidase [Acidobacteriaceae bacterium]
MDFFKKHHREYLEQLKAFLRIPSISTLSEHKPDIRLAAEFVKEDLQRSGLRNAHLIEGEGNPLVYAEWLGAPGKPTLLFYGHYDVQPPDPLDEWKSPPFEPDERNGNIYARGACDDKGQTFILMKAVGGLLHHEGKLPVNVRFLIEGEEEVGGEHIESFVKTKPPLLQADAAVICDTEMFAPDLPTICVGLRGMVYGEITVQGADHDLHSGVYGGVAPNPLMSMAEILTALKSPDGHIQIDGFYDRVQTPSDKEKEAWNRLPFDEAEYKQNEVGVKQLVGEPGLSVFDRTWARPTFEVHGIRGGFIGEGAKTVIPAKAVAKVSCRLVADQNPEEVSQQLRAAVQSACPKGVTVQYQTIHSAPASMVNPDNRYIHAAAEAMKKVFGRDTVYIRSGGSIPIVGLFDAYLKIPSVMMGFGLPDDNLHAPNEKFHIANFYRGIDSVAEYLTLLGA